MTVRPLLPTEAPPRRPGRPRRRLLVALLVAVIMLLAAGWAALAARTAGGLVVGRTATTSPTVDGRGSAAPGAADPGGAPAPSAGAGTATPTGATPSTPTPGTPTPGAATPGATGPAGVPPVLPAPRRSFPDADNTGVPAGTALSRYTGPCTITTPNALVDAKAVDCTLNIRATGVTIRRSRINGRVDTTEGTPHSYTLVDSEVNAGVFQGPAVGNTNMTILRSEIRGGATSVYCWSACTIRDSWLHGQQLAAGADWHLNGFLANDNGRDPGGRTNAVLVHNTIVCDAPPNSAGGGCSGHLNLYGDFGPVSHVTVDNNLFAASTVASYCVYGGTTPSKPYGRQTAHIKVVNNVFERGGNGKCAAYGPVTDFDTARPGNQWAGNVWDDGMSVGPAR